jgi:hypothetical protein
MQEINLAEFEPADDGVSRFSRVRRTVSTALGACIALALLVAMGMWFYRLGVRDAENVPIIRAAVQPAKVRPEDPGGAVAPYQDITSYRVADSNPAQATTAIIAPPPPEPRREDVAMGKLAPEPEREDTPAATRAPGPAAPPQASGISAPAPEPSAPATVIPVAATSGPASPSRPSPEAAPEVAADAGTSEIDALVAMVEPAETADAPEAIQPDDPVTSGSDYAPPVSPVAQPRPPDLKARMAAAVEAAERSDDELARRAAESEIQIQLAADPSEDVVHRMWQRISQANQDILHDRALSVQTTTSGGTKFYRLRVGPFGGVSEARALCQALKARGQDCIVARNG